ncbi:MAG TPA: tryptophan 7-halogenase [Thermoanaerobaculia bacterium]|nr:tryptophan 7-halogenase [Thermoanaerobaculia bacterium]
MQKGEDAPRLAIAGGGPAGAVAALVAARRGLRVTVLEARSEPDLKMGETLPPGLTPLLRHLGLDAWLERDGHLRSQGNRSLWGSDRAEESPFLANPLGAGWHVDRRRFEARLAEAAQEAGAEWRWGCRLKSCTAQGKGWRLALSSADSLDADFVADATGRQSRLARRLGARRLRYDRLVGISALLESRTPAVDTYTLVEATPDGWWYSALLSDGRLAVAFLSDGDLLDRSMRGAGADPEAWWQRLRQTTATRERVEGNGYQTAAPLRVLPAETSRLDTIVGDKSIALGDAAAAYDPLSSHGVASAMGSGFYGGHAVVDLLAGRSEARLAYLDLLQRAYGTCLDLQREHYRRETRWPDSPFWRRRHAESYGLIPPSLLGGSDARM